MARRQGVLYITRNAKPYEDCRTCRYEIWYQRPRRIDKEGLWGPPQASPMGDIDPNKMPIKLKRGEGPVKVKLALATKTTSKRRLLYVTRNAKPYPAYKEAVCELWTHPTAKLGVDGHWGPTANFQGEVTLAQCPVDMKLGDGPIAVVLVVA